MINIENMSLEEMRHLLQRTGFGHLGCSRDDHPYVVPMNYAYDGSDVYLFTTEGTKTEYLAANPEVCLQVEEMTDSSNWKSVMVTGRAERITNQEEIERAMQFITERHPTLTPALNRTKIGAWTRLSNIALYIVRPDAVYGRKSV